MLRERRRPHGLRGLPFRASQPTAAQPPSTTRRVRPARLRAGAADDLDPLGIGVCRSRPDSFARRACSPRPAANPHPGWAPGPRGRWGRRRQGRGAGQGGGGRRPVSRSGRWPISPLPARASVRCRAAPPARRRRRPSPTATLSTSVMKSEPLALQAVEGGSLLGWSCEPFRLLRRAASLLVGGRDYEIFRLDALQAHYDVARLPFSLKVLLENLLRNEDGEASARRTSRRSPAGTPAAEPSDRDRVHAGARADAGLHRRARGRRPRRDARRDARRWAATRRKINPLVAGRAGDRPLGAGRRVRHRATRSRATPSSSSSATASATRSCAGARARSTTSRSCRPTPGSSTRSTSSTSPGSSSSTTRDGAPSAYPDTLVGTDSHTTMVNGLGVLGWGVGGIEAEAAMLGQPMSMLIPQVVGFKLNGALPEGATATDLVLTVTEMLREHGVVGKFVEFYGAGLAAPAARRPRDDRQHVARVRLDLRDLPDRRRDAALPGVLGPAARSRSSWSRPTPRSRGCGTTRHSEEPTLHRRARARPGDGRAEHRRARSARRTASR